MATAGEPVNYSGTFSIPITTNNTNAYPIAQFPVPTVTGGYTYDPNYGTYVYNQNYPMYYTVNITPQQLKDMIKTALAEMFLELTRQETAAEGA